MTQIIDSLPTDCANRLLCCYSNDDRKMKLARITNIPNWYFERVVFPGERLLFEALPEAQLEIYITNFSTVALVEVTTCDRLAVKNSPLIKIALSSNKKNFRTRQIKALTLQQYSLAKRILSVTWGDSSSDKDCL